jgi:hypothetical protein
MAEPINRDEKGRIVKGSGGRQKGAKNHYTIDILNAVSYVFEKIGGQEELLRWASSSPRNKATFFNWLMKMLPANVSASVDHTVGVSYDDVMKALQKAEDQKSESSSEGD